MIRKVIYVEVLDLNTNAHLVGNVLFKLR